MTTQIAPYGSWRSPITAQRLTARSVRLAEPQVDGSALYWLEARPDEQGRCALRVQTAQGVRDCLPAPWSVRSRAHEYGGGSYLASNGWLYFVAEHDQRVYRLAPDSEQPEPLSPVGPYRHADLSLDPQRARLLCVREDASAAGEPQAQIIALSLQHPGQVEILVQGADFYSNPRLSPNGQQLAWLCWYHPNMPWDGTECHLAELDPEGRVGRSRCLAGSASESIFQPQWSPAGELYFVSDRSDWWNLYRWDGTQTQAVYPLDAEFATPQWVFGMSTYGFLDTRRLLCTYTRAGRWHLGELDLQQGEWHERLPALSDITGISCAAGRGAFLGASPTQGSQLWAYQNGTAEVVASASAEPLPAAYLAEPRALSFATEDGATAHGFFYPPCNPDYRAPEGTQPPLLVLCHGGPTGATESSLNPKIQYWTSRGFAVFDINYRGSTGYGRRYREQLKGNWGITDVIDMCSGAAHLVRKGWVDPQQLAIRGSSAGGYTVLASLTFRDDFKAGASLYGIGDLEMLTRDTHKFESRYLDSLIGPYPAAQARYRERSPIHHIERLQCPVIFLQGLADKIVPPNQAEAMVAALTAKGIANAYVSFAEEGHGFRHSQNIQRALEAELFFYSRVFGFSCAEPLPPITLNGELGESGEAIAP